MSAERVRGGDHRLASVLLDDVEWIAERSVARMQELLPSYAKVPAERLIPVTLANTRNLLEAVRDPDADPTRLEDHVRGAGRGRTQAGDRRGGDAAGVGYRAGGGARAGTPRC